MTPDHLTTADGRTVLRLERPLPHPPEKVFRALTTPAHLAAWFPSTVDVELRVGGAVVFDGGELHGVVTAYDPPRRFAFTWDTDHLDWEVRPAGGGSVLVLHHAFDDRYGAASFAAGWSACLAELAAALGTAGEPGDGVDVVTAHEEYVRAFDLDAPVVTDGTARVERQLTAPAERVRALLEPAEQGWDLVPGTGHGPRLVATAPAAEADRLRARVAEIAAACARAGHASPPAGHG